MILRILVGDRGIHNLTTLLLRKMKKLPAEVQKLQVLVVHENVEIMYESS